MCTKEESEQGQQIWISRNGKFGNGLTLEARLRCVPRALTASWQRRSIVNELHQTETAERAVFGGCFFAAESAV
jgi:hypothetical protein